MINLYFSYWAWRSPWRYVVSLKTFVKFLSWDEKSGTQFFRSSNLPVDYKSGQTTSIQIIDIWWSSLVIMDDFKLISRPVFFRLGEINKSWFWVLSKKFFLNFFLVGYWISNYKKIYKNFWQKSKSWIVYFTVTEKKLSGNELKIIHAHLTKLDQQISIIWIEVAGPLLQPTSRFDILKNWVTDCSAQDRNLTKSY